jgi:hypothetical protein
MGLSCAGFALGAVIGACGFASALLCTSILNEARYNASTAMNSASGLFQFPVVGVMGSSAAPEEHRPCQRRTGFGGPIRAPMRFRPRGAAVALPREPLARAATLSDVLELYDTRFAIGFTAAEKADLIAFLRTLRAAPSVAGCRTIRCV